MGVKMLINKENIRARVRCRNMLMKYIKVVRGNV